MLIKPVFKKLLLFSILFSSMAVIAEDNFIALDLEDLMDIEVYSVSRSKQSVLDSAAAVYVIDKNQIKNSGLQSIPEILRLAPGVQVSQISSHTWSVSMRGFGGKHENKLLVMMDGRSLYTPFFSGVYWDMQSINLDNIERIEVVRGPGGTLWGANAVNGVINIITKNSADTQAGMLTATIGNLDSKSITARYGDKINDSSSYRLSTKYAESDPFDLVAGKTIDKLENKLVSFRYDTSLDEDQELIIMGRLSEGEAGSIDSMISPVAPYSIDKYNNIETRAYDLQFDYTKQLADDAQLSLKSYYEHLYRLESLMALKMDIFNLDFQHSFYWQDQHHLIWGMDYRYLQTDGIGDENIGLSQSHHNDYIASIFIQDDISLLDKSVFLTIGAKVQKQSFTDVEVQPNIRLRWKMSEHQTSWAAISRAIRTPSITEKYMSLRYAYYPTGPGQLGSGGILGNQSLKSEKLIAYEAGFKQKFSNSLNFDLSFFYHEYDQLRDHHDSLIPSYVTSPVPHTEYNSQFNNLLTGNVYGLEFASSWKLSPGLLLRFNYTYTEIDIDTIDGSANVSIQELENKNHNHMASVDLNWQLSSKFDVGSQVYYYSGFDFPATTQEPKQSVNSFVRIDLRFAYQVTKNLELTLVGQNLLDSKHTEYYKSGDVYNAYIEPTYYLQGSLKF